MSETHIPVLREELLTYLNPKSAGLYVDATIGLGGHSLSILQKSTPIGQLIGVDQDDLALAKCEKRLKVFEDRLRLIHANFSDLQNLLELQGVSKVDGVIFDLGVSSFQLNTPERGFSFQQSGPLDMRMNQQMPISASQIVNDSTPETLVKIFKEYGEERYSKVIAQRIVASRLVEPITTTQQLSQIVMAAIPRKTINKKFDFQHQNLSRRIHPATRVFQALRIEVNDELKNLKIGIDAAVSVLKKDGCLCVISFHSLEDRIVKQKFQFYAKSCICPPKTPICVCNHQKMLKVITRRPVLPSANEVDVNPRSRSAKMRVAVRV